LKGIITLLEGLNKILKVEKKILLVNQN